MGRCLAGENSRGGLICCCSGSLDQFGYLKAGYLQEKALNSVCWPIVPHTRESKHLISAFYFHISELVCYHFYLLSLNFLYWLKHEREGCVSACCREIHVVDEILWGWCSWSEKTGVKAEGHLTLSVFSAAHGGTTNMSLVSLQNNPFLGKTRWYSSQSSSKQLSKYLPITRAEMMIMRVWHHQRCALIGQILQRAHTQSTVCLV